MPPLTWKEEPNDSQIGQLFFYLVAQQLEATKLCMHPNPIVGMFMGGGGGRCVCILPLFCSIDYTSCLFQFCTVVARERGTQINLNTSDLFSLDGGAMVMMCTQIFKVLSMNP